ncbi:MAG: hypothetical protein SFX73_02575 [Kofleriaceae bacterium]|nr:hypothetical protein [Kofleriaceae bacterium]
MKSISKTVLAGSFAGVLGASLLVGCKGEKVIQPDPQTKADLDSCIASKSEKEKFCKSLEDEVARLTREQGSGSSEIVVSIEGNALTVKPGKPGDPPRPIDDKAAGEASKQFIDVVAKSRGAIQKCYEQALKKDAGLQARTITLTVSASFSNAGAYKSASFSPSLGETFDACIRGVATKWALPTNSPAMTFKAQVSLTPS